MSKDILRAKEVPDFIVDRKVGALINTNRRALEAHKQRRERNRKVDRLEERLDSIEKNLANINQLLDRIANKTPRTE